jgi:hypothetical protein
MPSLAGFLLLPLLGGFFFLYFYNRTRFSFRKLEGHRLFFPAAIWGLIFFAASRLITLALAATSLHSRLRGPLKSFADFDFSGASIGALLLGLTLPWLGNLRWRRSPRPQRGRFIDRLWPFESNRSEALLEVARQNDDLLYLLLQAHKQARQVLVILDNGKAYVGYVLDATPSLDLPYIKLLPTVSGYRSRETLDLELTTVYEKAVWRLTVLEKRKHLPRPANPTVIKSRAARQALLENRLRSSQVVLKREKIVSANFFDQRLYEVHQRERERKKAEAAALAATRSSLTS